MPEFTKQDGRPIHYDVQGSSDLAAIVLIEGLSAHLLGWRNEFCRYFLDAGYRVVRFDNRDVGLSARYPDREYDLRDMADDVHELIRHLGIAPAHIVGQSMGGMIAQQLVLRYPTDVASMSLLYTSGATRHLNLAARGPEALASIPRALTRAEAIEFHVQQERWCASTSFSFDQAWKSELGGLMWDRGYDPDGVARQLTAVLHTPMDVRGLSSVAAPTLIVHGTGDALISHIASVELNEAIPDSELWIVEGMGHDLPRELWGDLTSRILDNAGRAQSPHHSGVQRPPRPSAERSSHRRESAT